MAFDSEHFRGGAGRDEGVEAGDGSAHDADEDEGEDATGDVRTTAIGEDMVDGWGFEAWVGDDDPDDEETDGPDFQEATDVVARAEEDPDGEDGSDEAVEADSDDGVFAGEGEDGFERGAGDPIPDDGRGEDADGAEDGGFHDFAGSDAIHVESDEEGDGDCAEDGEEAPTGAFDAFEGAGGEGDFGGVVESEGFWDEDFEAFAAGDFG